MRFEFSCPGCGVRALEFEAFETAIMLAPNLALMRFECPTCKTPLLIKVRLNKAQSDYLSKVQNSFIKTSGIFVQPEAESLRATSSPSPTGSDSPFDVGQRTPEITYSAKPVVDVNNGLLHILKSPSMPAPEAERRANEFRRLLEQIESVDEAIKRIDSAQQGNQPEGDANDD